MGLEKMKCPDCRAEMTIYGVFESGVFRFHCSKCYRMLSEIESQTKRIKNGKRIRK